MAFRSRYFIDRETQLNLVFSFLVMVLIIAVITFSNFTYFAIFFKEFVLSEPEAAGLNSIIDSAIATFKGRLLLLFVIDILILFVMGILISHRIAGPIYKFGRRISKYLTGDMTEKITLRRTDLLFELADSLNSYFDFLRSKLQRLKDLTAELPESDKKHELQKELECFKLK
ncbi:MAG: methyl-accepting chemotaxis protein [Candidatus Wallbacteria bacterium]|nr:methyl-accepting chemotaxis protein [Candidatus Wallbacteria bacterium]